MVAGAAVLVAHQVELTPSVEAERVSSDLAGDEHHVHSRPLDGDTVDHVHRSRDERHLGADRHPDLCRVEEPGLAGEHDLVAARSHLAHARLIEGR